jgi:unsaturated rhamnogalacturonyl hydrolase
MGRHGPEAARGNGWVAAGLSELLVSLPLDNPHRPRIMEGYRSMMASLVMHQDENGMWHQLIGQPESWPETSCSAMFTFAISDSLRIL